MVEVSKSRIRREKEGKEGGRDRGRKEGRRKDGRD